MTAFAALMTAVLLLGCGGLHAETTADLQTAAKATALARRHLDAGTVEFTLVSAAHCANQAALRNEGLPLIDAGIACP